MHKHAHERGYLRKSRNNPEFGMYVYNHGGYANETLSWLIEPYVRCQYIGAFYLHGSGQSWGIKEGANGIILQVQPAEYVRGHFRRFSYDPWQPELSIAYVRSIRYYKFIEEGAA